MFNPKISHKHRIAINLSLGFVFFDLLFFVIYWLIGQGYISLSPEMHSVVMTIIGKIWNVLHMPVHEFLGWLFFPILQSGHGYLSLIAYVMTCLLQMFAVMLIFTILATGLIKRAKADDGEQE